MTGEVSKVLKIHCPGCGQKLDVSDLPAFHRFPCPACRAEVIVPRRFGEFMLEELIGSGGMARVYRALHITLDREVAVKVLRAEVHADPGCVSLFLEAARRAAAVNHPHVAPIYSSGAEESQPYLVMEYMAGGSLGKQIERHGASIPLQTCMRYVRDAAKGLDAAFRRGLLHHDVKPANILLDSDGNVKVGDFGLAQAFEAEGPPRGDGHARFVTPGYASPERISSAEEDVRGDIFSLGAVLYHLVAGRPPWSGPDFAAVLEARALGPPPAVDESRPGVPAQVSALIQQMMAEAPDKRPADYSEIIADLNRFLRKPATAVGTGLGAGSASGAATRRLFVARQAPERSAPRRGPRQGASRGVFLMMNLGLAGGVLLAATALVLGVRRQAPWYTRYVKPFVGRLGFDAAPGRSRGVRSVPAKAAGEIAGRSGRTSAPAMRDPGSLAGAAGTGGPPAAAPSGEGKAASAVGRPRARLPGMDGTDGGAPPSVDISSRPQPEDLDFSRVRTALARHLARQSPEARRMEEERLEILKGCRSYLVQLMKYLPYEAPVTGIELRGGRRLKGSVPLCNDSGIAVKGPGVGGGLRQVGWGELSFDQIVDFFSYYIKIRLARELPKVPGNGDADPRKAAAQDCFRLALLCDWYGKTAMARHWAARAADLAPGLAPRIRRYVPTRTR